MGVDIFTTGGYLSCHKPFSGEPMTPVQLADFVGQHGQEEAAKKLGTSQAAISKAIRSGRQIVVRSRAGGSLEAFELKAFPSSGSVSRPRADLELIMSVIAVLAEPTEGAVRSYSPVSSPV
ncbi:MULTISPECIES: Cro/CI family transcriptional regulator [unclassified Pseudomonas]|uniref:Cro/CI family transcriptional regulator n=1 Tax=Pseudomonas sp. 13.2 TaxID=3144665 RepID=A0AAU7BEW1_9PSED|nr:Cro/CI family transcriptional regulator [Pseudomonas sp. SWI36]